MLLYKVLVILLFIVVGLTLYLKPKKDQTQKCSLTKNIGVLLLILASVALLYLVVYPEQKAQMTWAETVSNVGGKWVDMVGSNTKAIVNALAQHPELLQLAAAAI